MWRVAVGSLVQDLPGEGEWQYGFRSRNGVTVHDHAKQFAVEVIRRHRTASHQHSLTNGWRAAKRRCERWPYSGKRQTSKRRCLVVEVGVDEVRTTLRR
jgi:hypothetical protein